MTRTSNVATRVRTVAERTPTARAIDAFDEVLDYRALVSRASTLGGALADAGVRRGQTVGILLHKSGAIVVAMLACHHLGAAFTPLDPSLPPARLSRMIADAGIAVVIARETDGALARELGVTFVDLGAHGPDRPPVVLEDDDLAYVIFTSGSTGVPKGVEILHRGLLPLIDAQIAAFQVDSSSRSLLLLSTNFDACLSDVFTTLVAGATLHVPEPAAVATVEGLRSTLRARRITHVDLPPALLRVLPADALAEVRVVIVGGEPSSPALLRRWASRVRLVAVYGPTEATICASLTVVDAHRWDRPSLGEPLPHVRLLLLPGGELGIGGPCLARGYSAQPALTAERFVMHEGERIYRTGDLVRASPDGTFEFLGRRDRQLKLHGRLIAPEEIEAALLAHPAVREVLVACEAGALVAHVVPLEERSMAPATSMRAHLAESLPSWMLPTRFVTHSSFPRTASGKIDASAIAASSSSDGKGPEKGRGGPPEGPRERTIARIFQEILGIGELGREDDFFALGGDSLGVLAFVAAAEAERLGIPTEAFTRPSTIAELAVARETTMSVAALEDDTRPLVRAPESTTAGVERARDRSRRTVFVTGATGFLGVHLVAALLLRDDVEVIALVRASDDTEAKTRLDRALRANVDTAKLSPKRARIVAGDISVDRFGLSGARWDELARSVDHVFHVAAEVSYARSHRDLREANVVGTARVLELAARGGAAFAHASTLDVIDGALEVRGGYAQSKWAAEWLVRRSREGACPTSIHRFGLLAASDATLARPRDELLARFLWRTRDHGVDPELLRDGAIDLEPVDHAAAAMVHFALDAEVTKTYLHGGKQRILVCELVQEMRAQGLDVVVRAGGEAPSTSSALFAGDRVVSRPRESEPKIPFDRRAYVARLIASVFAESGSCA